MPFGLWGATKFVPKIDVGMSVRRTALAEIDRVVSEGLGRARVPGNAQPAAFNRQVAMYLAQRVTGNAQPAAFNRQVAMYLAKRVGGWRVTRIGNFYNGRHKMTVCHAIRRIERLARRMPTWTALKALVEEIKTGPASDSHALLQATRLNLPPAKSAR